ncbi:MAG: hypothetical protein J3K34DRAFT_521497 [Monoraphidium minutum]|nr:MAG: hypothetical protein J3K34DRAFT_521497 [Monoraphidium minutum]
MGFASVITSILMVGQLAVAGLIIGLTATKLNSIKLGLDVAKLDANITDTCLMGTGPNGVNLCYVAYGFSGVSVLATAALGLLLCCTCNLCGLGKLLDTLFALAGAAWWAIAGVVFNFYTKQPEIAALPQGQARGWIIILCWIGCALFAAAFLVNLFSLLSACCRCCGGGDTRRRDVESAGPRWRGWSGRAPPPPRDGLPAGYPRVGRAAKQGQFIQQDIAPTAYWAPAAR